MSKISFLMLFLILSCSSAFAERVPSVLEVSADGSEIKMDDGFVWEVRPRFDGLLGFMSFDHRSEVLSWIPGDEVQLYWSFHFNISIFYLVNLRTSSEIQVAFSRKNCDWIASYILDVTVLDSSTFFSFEGRITLSDGTIWHTNSSDVASWTIGDRVMVYPSYGVFVMINPDHGLKHNWDYDHTKSSCAYLKTVSKD